MPVYQLLSEMPYTEFVKWMQFTAERPPGWRADNRAAAIVISNGAKIKPEMLFPSLAAVNRAAEKRRDKEEDKMSSSSFLNSKMFKGLKHSWLS